MIEWISVKDRLPEKTSIYLVKLRDDYRTRINPKFKVTRCWFSPLRQFKDHEFEYKWRYKKEKVNCVTHWAEINLPSD